MEQGQYLDVSMMDTSFLLMANMVTEHLNSGWIPKPMGNEAQSGSPSSGMYQTKTTPLLLAANTNDQFSGLCDALNTLMPFEKNKWKSLEYRKNNQSILRSEIQKIFILKSSDFLEKLLNDFQVPAGKIRTIPEAVSEEQFCERKLWTKVNIKSINKEFLVPSIGFKVNENAIVARKPPPTLGGDTISILRSLGFCENEIDDFKKKEIIG